MKVARTHAPAARTPIPPQLPSHVCSCCAGRGSVFGQPCKCREWDIDGTAWGRWPVAARATCAAEPPPHLPHGVAVRRCWNPGTDFHPTIHIVIPNSSMSCSGSAGLPGHRLRLLRLPQSSQGRVAALQRRLFRAGPHGHPAGQAPRKQRVMQLPSTRGPASSARPLCHGGRSRRCSACGQGWVGAGHAAEASRPQCPPRQFRGLYCTVLHLFVF